MGVDFIQEINASVYDIFKSLNLDCQEKSQRQGYIFIYLEIGHLFLSKPYSWKIFGHLPILEMYDSEHNTIYSVKYSAHCSVVLCVLRHQSAVDSFGSLCIFVWVAPLTVGYSQNCPGAGKVTVIDINKTNLFQTLLEHNKAWNIGTFLYYHNMWLLFHNTFISTLSCVG